MMLLYIAIRIYSYTMLLNTTMLLSMFVCSDNEIIYSDDVCLQLLFVVSMVPHPCC